VELYLFFPYMLSWCGQGQLYLLYVSAASSGDHNLILPRFIIVLYLRFRKLSKVKTFKLVSKPKRCDVQKSLRTIASGDAS